MKKSEEIEKQEEPELFQKKRRKWKLLSDFIEKATKDPENEPDSSGSLDEYGRYIE